MEIKNVRAIDLFSGAGGSSIGAQQAGAEIVAGFDLWEMAGDVYKYNFPNAKFFPFRLQEINIKNISDELGEIDLILASPECTNHSIARGRKERDKESLNLAYQVIRFAKTLKPRWIVIENVTSMRNWDGYQEFLIKLGEHYHYRVQSLVASEFGVPQKRRRLFIICDRKIKPSPVQIPENLPSLTAGDILSKNGTYSLSPLFADNRAKATIARAERAIKALGENSSFLLVYYGSDKAGGWQRLDVPLRTVTTLDRFALVIPGEEGYMMRMLQPPELQKAMGFPISFKLNAGNRRQKIHMLGNAVCPPVMKAIVEHLIA